MNKKEAYEILTNPNTTIIDFATNTISKQWKEAHNLAINNLKERCN